MSYQERISTARTGCLIVMIDQSYSMAEPWGSEGPTKAEVLADTVNALMATAVVRCTSGRTVKDRFDVGVLGYRDDAVHDILGGADSTRPTQSLILRPISHVASSPSRVDDRVQTIEGRDGQFTEMQFKMPVWVDPVASGNTPMNSGFRAVISTLEAWLPSHLNSYPPIIFNITDAAASDGNPEELARRLCALETRDGAALLFNIHISRSADRTFIFPQADHLFRADAYASLLYRMSSILPASMVRAARDAGIDAGPESRAFAHNANPADLLEVLDIGSVPLLGPNVFASRL